MKTLVRRSRYLRLLAEQRARRRKEREPGYQPGRQSPTGQEPEEGEAAAFEARSAAAALAYEREAREKRESKLMFNTARVWVDIIVEQAVFESEQRARAAARLQARVRGDQQRGESKRMRRAIVKVQAAARARQVCGPCAAVPLSHSSPHRKLMPVLVVGPGPGCAVDAAGQQVAPGARARRAQPSAGGESRAIRGGAAIEAAGRSQRASRGWAATTLPEAEPSGGRRTDLHGLR